MKKILFLAALCVAIGSMAETAFLYNADSHELTQTKNGITVTIAQGSGANAPLWKESYNEEYTPSDMRLYLGNTITVSSSTALTDIKMVFAKSAASNKEYAKLSANVGNLVSGGTAESHSDWKVDSWTGNATSVTFTLTDKGLAMQEQAKHIPECLSAEILNHIGSIEELTKMIPTLDKLIEGLKQTNNEH